MVHELLARPAQLFCAAHVVVAFGEQPRKCWNGCL